MDKWYMLIVVGKDRPGIVAKVTSALFEGGCHLGESSMMRLGGNFTIMMMVRHDGNTHSLRELIEPVTESLGLQLHVDRIKGELHHHIEPDVRITVSGADRAGIVSQVTGALAEAGLHILNLESDVAGREGSPNNIMHIEGQALEGVDALQSALDIAIKGGIEASLSPIDTLIG